MNYLNLFVLLAAIQQSSIYAFLQPISNSRRISYSQKTSSWEKSQQLNLLRRIDGESIVDIGFDPVTKTSRVTRTTRLYENGYIIAEGSGSPCRIKVIGVGGGGGNAVNRMVENSEGGR